MRIWMTSLALPALLLAAGCIRLKSEPVEVKPIHITVDVNVRMERELQDFFGEIDKQDPTMADEADQVE
jgi:hypothetical protein